MDLKKTSAYLFDLDGTLLDTVHDLLIALNHLRNTYGHKELTLAEVRGIANHGAKAFLKLGLNIKEEDKEFNEMRNELLTTYAKQKAERTVFFPRMTEVLKFLDDQNIPWGIVTNRTTALTNGLLDILHFTHRPKCIVCADMVKDPKPSPLSLLMACDLLNKKPEECVFIGDAMTDVQAGKAAGMPTLLALYGYIHPEEDPYSWGADGYLKEPYDLLGLLEVSN